jgi:hypothetical protein
VVLEFAGAGRMQSPVAVGLSLGLTRARQGALQNRVRNSRAFLWCCAPTREVQWRFHGAVGEDEKDKYAPYTGRTPAPSALSRRASS